MERREFLSTLAGATPLLMSVVNEHTPLILEWSAKSFPGIATVFDAVTGEKIQKVRKLEFYKGLEKNNEAVLIGVAVVTRFMMNPDGTLSVDKEANKIRTIVETRYVRLVWKPKTVVRG